MTKRKPSKLLKGNLPAQETSAPGAAPDSRFLGYGEPYTPEVLNRGVYAVAKEVDAVFEEVLKLQRKAVTSVSSKKFTFPLPDFIFRNDTDSDDTSAYMGISPSTTPKTLIELFQSEGNNLSVPVEAAYTAYSLNFSPNEDVIDFQLLTLPAYSAEILFTFSIGGSSSVTYSVGTGPNGEDELSVVALATDTWADVATAINADSVAQTKVVAIGGSNTVHTSHPAASSQVSLTPKAQVDADIVGVFLDDPFTGSKFFASLGVALATYDSVSETFTLSRDLTGTGLGSLSVDDYVIIVANPTSASLTTPYPCSRVAVTKVTSVTPDPVTSSGDSFSVDNFELFSSLGVQDSDIEFLIYSVPKRHWAVGHTHDFDVPKAENPSPAEFAGFNSTDNSHWFQTVGGIPFSSFSSGKEDIIRVAKIKYLMGQPDGSDPVSAYTNDDINAETSSGLPLYDNTSARPSVLISPKFSGSSVAVHLEDLRFVFDNADAPFLSSDVTVYTYDENTDSFVSPVTLKLETLSVSGSKVLTRLDPFSGSIPFGTAKYYKIIFNTSSGSSDSGTGTLSRVYFSGTYGASPVLKIASDKIITGAEFWFVHEPGDGYTELPNMTLDIYVSSTGEGGSFVKLVEGSPLYMSHVIHRGPLNEQNSGVYQKVVAYRAMPFPEGYEVSTGDHLLFFINQNRPVSDLRRVIKAQLVESHKNQSAGHIGAYIGDSIAGGSYNSNVTEVIPLSYTSSGFTAAGSFDAGSVTLTGVASGDYLVVENGPNAGVYKIDSVAGSTITLATSAFSGTPDSGVMFRVVQGSSADPMIPAGIEGGVSDYWLVSNVSVAGDAILSYGQFTRIEDIPPDGFRVSASSTGDTGFLSSKIAEIMGEAITNTVPSTRTLIGLSDRIDSIQQVSIGLGIPGQSFGKINVDEYADLNSAFTSAVNQLPLGGVIVFKPGTYGDGSSTASNVWSGPIVVPAGVYVVAEQELSATLSGADVYLQNDNSGIKGFKTENSTIRVSPPGSLNAVDNVTVSTISQDSASSIILGDSDPVDTWKMIKAIQRLRIINISGGQITTPIDLSDQQIGTTYEGSPTNNITFRDVACNSISLAHFKDVEFFNVNTPSLEILWCESVRATGGYFGLVDVILSNRFLVSGADIDNVKINTSTRSAVLNCTFSHESTNPNSTTSVLINIFNSTDVVIANNTAQTPESTGSNDYIFVFVSSGSHVTIANNTAITEEFLVASNSSYLRLNNNVYRSVSSTSSPTPLSFSFTNQITVEGLTVNSADFNTNPFPSGNIITLLNVDNSIFSGIISEVAAAKIYYLDCNNLIFNNIRLKNGDLVPSGNNTAIQISNYSASSNRSLWVPALPSKPVMYFETETSTSMSDGMELMKFGNSPSTRIWSVNGTLILTTNVSSFTYSGGTFSNVNVEITNEEGKLQILGSADKELLSRITSTGALSRIAEVTEEASSGGPVHSLTTDLHKVTFNQNLFNGFFRFSNGVAITYNLNWDPPTANESFSAPYWTKQDLYKRAAAWILMDEGEIFYAGLLENQETSGTPFSIWDYRGNIQERGSIYIFHRFGPNDGVSGGYTRIVNNQIVSEPDDINNDSSLILGGTRSPVHISMAKTTTFNKPSGFYLANPNNGSHGGLDNPSYGYSGIVFYDNANKMHIAATDEDGDIHTDLAVWDLANKKWKMSNGIGKSSSNLIFTVEQTYSWSSTVIDVNSGVSFGEGLLIGVYDSFSIGSVIRSIVPIASSTGSWYARIVTSTVQTTPFTNQYYNFKVGFAFLRR